MSRWPLKERRIELLKDHPLAGLNTWGVGGACRAYYRPRDLRDASASVISALKSGSGLYVLGGGSNVLVADGRVDASVVHTEGLDHIRVSRTRRDGAAVVEAGAGVPVKKLLALSIEEGLGGLEFLTGIPGSLGGALWGNAGAGNAGFHGIIEEAEGIDPEGSPVTVTADSLVWSYRNCPFDRDRIMMLTSSRLRLRPSSRGDIFGSIRRYADMKKGQPLGMKTAGCVFKNPSGGSAGLLLDRSGCKGLRVGGAVVSCSHANFIINAGGASSDDIFRLCEICRGKVLDLHGVELEYEIKFLGFFEKG